MWQSGCSLIKQRVVPVIMLIVFIILHTMMVPAGYLAAFNLSNLILPLYFILSKVADK